MSEITLYNEAGEITRWVDCNEEFHALQPMSGECFLIGKFSEQEFYVDAPTGRLVDMPERPSANHTFDYATKQWADLRTPQDLLDAVRRKRTALLLASDWTQLPDVPVATREAWAAYRQALRDITGQNDMREVIWPVGPKVD
jgi:hypothetical protein